MRIKIAFAAFALFGATAAAGQPVELPPVVYPDLPEAARDVAGFVPAGWTTLSRQQGDLNGDGAPDLVLLLRKNDPANILTVPLGEESRPLDTNPHLLVVAFAERSGGYRRAAASRGLFPRPTVPATGDVPPGEETIRIERRAIVVFFEHLRGWSSYRFQWRSGTMRLIGYDDGGAFGGCVFTTSIDYLAGRARLTAASISSDRERSAWRRMEAIAPPTLDLIDLNAFDPESAIAGPPLTCDGVDG